MSRFPIDYISFVLKSLNEFNALVAVFFKFPKENL